MSSYCQCCGKTFTRDELKKGQTINGISIRQIQDGVYECGIPSCREKKISPVVENKKSA